MSWKAKSEDSFNVTNKLIQDSFCNISVHCSYYSCVQLMFYVLSEYLGMRDDEIDSESATQSSSHIWLINKVTNQLKQISSKREARAFNDDIHALRKSRIIADYHKDSISKEKAKELRQLSFDLNDCLTKSFSL